MSKIYVVGIGPGAYDQMTGRAIRALNESDVIIGYTVYVDLVKEYFAGKEFMTTPMKKVPVSSIFSLLSVKASVH